MAINETSPGMGWVLPVATGKKSGDPVVVGAALPGVCQTDRDANGNSIVAIKSGVWAVPVKGINGSGNTAIAVGDKLYYTGADTPPLSAKATGVPWGIALEAVVSGATTTIKVLLLPGL